MALEAPNFFDEFERMRTVSQSYDPNVDYSRIIAQLMESCREYGYLGISPQNLVEPAELLPVVVLPYYDKPMRAFVDPHIVETSGGRIQIEGCANIKLVRDGKKFPVGVKVYRPQHIVFSHAVDGRRVTETYRDTQPEQSLDPCPVGVLCHEIQHTRGILLADLARQRMLNMRATLAKEIGKMPELEKELRNYMDIESPRALVRHGDGYVMRFMSELGSDIPPVSPDALFFDYGFRRSEDICRTFVPRGGELLPIELSDRARLLLGLA